MFFKILCAVFLNIALGIAFYGVAVPYAVNELPGGSGFILVGVGIILQLWINWTIFKKPLKALGEKIKEDF